MYFMHYSCAVIILFNTGLYKSAFSNYLLIVLSFCAFCVYFWCVEFDVIFLKFYNICIIIVFTACVRCFCSHLLEANYKNVKKIWLQLPIKNIPPGSFWVLKILFIKKNVDIHKMKECKKTLSTNIFFSRKFRMWKIYFGASISSIEVLLWR